MEYQIKLLKKEMNIILKISLNMDLIKMEEQQPEKKKKRLQNIMNVLNNQLLITDREKNSRKKLRDKILQYSMISSFKIPRQNILEPMEEKESIISLIKKI